MIKIEDAYKEFNTYVSEYDFDVSLLFYDRLIEKFSDIYNNEQIIYKAIKKHKKYVI